jgi:hypothetical protein
MIYLMRPLHREPIRLKGLSDHPFMLCGIMED